MTLQSAGDKPVDYNVSIRPKSVGNFEVTIRSHLSTTVYSDVRASLIDATTVRVEMESILSNYSVVLEKPMVQKSTSQSDMERLHVFHNGRKTILQIPPPRWLKQLTEETASALGGGLKAPMPSLVVDVKVSAGAKVEKGQIVVVLESMKTEIVLRASQAGMVKSVNCKQGDMVAEGMELISLQEG